MTSLSKTVKDTYTLHSLFYSKYNRTLFAVASILLKHNEGSNLIDEKRVSSYSNVDDVDDVDGGCKI
jgi:hypothetical protein